MPTVNEATGEVTLELQGVVFKLRATMPRLADFEAALGSKGIGAIHRALSEAQPMAIYQGLRCLCASGNAEALDDMLLIPVLEEALRGLSMALVAGLPPARRTRGNSHATAVSETPQRRGRDTESSPTAS